MAKLKFTVHPLFICFGIYFVACGKVFSFLSFTAVAVIHELGHSIVAQSLGYRLSAITLMPYGAIVRGEERLFSYVDEIKIALAGPLTNLLTAVLFIALWWVEPQSYAYTDTAVFACLSVAAVNLLPCYPLDGGRVLLAFLSARILRRTALKIVRALGLILSALLLACFIWSAFTSVNLSLLFFSSFVLFGNIFVSKDNEYVSVYLGMDVAAVQKGRVIKRVAVTESTKVRSLYKFVTKNDIFEIVVFDNDGRIKKTLSADKAYSFLSKARPYSTLGEETRRLETIL